MCTPNKNTDIQRGNAHKPTRFREGISHSLPHIFQTDVNGIEEHKPLSLIQTQSLKIVSTCIRT